MTCYLGRYMTCHPGHYKFDLSSWTLYMTCRLGHYLGLVILDIILDLSYGHCVYIVIFYI